MNVIGYLVHLTMMNIDLYEKIPFIKHFHQKGMRSCQDFQTFKIRKLFLCESIIFALHIYISDSTRSEDFRRPAIAFV